MECISVLSAIHFLLNLCCSKGLLEKAILNEGNMIYYLLLSADSIFRKRGVYIYPLYRAAL